MLQRRALQTRPTCRPSAVRRAAVVRVRASAEYDTLRGAVAYKASSGDPVELLSLWEPVPGSKAVIAFLTHFADLSSWELAQKLVKVIPTLEASGVRVALVGLGSVQNAQEFARVLNVPMDRLYASPDGGALYRALGFSGGFGEDLPVSPYLKLLPMLAGVGSPGTLQEVIRGYVGDQAAKPVFDSPTPFDILGAGYQRPFELATLRLFNMIGILPKWSELSPPDETLLTQQGGSLVFSGDAVLFKHVDSGILRYTDVDTLMQTALQADYVPTAIDTVDPGMADGEL
ncbi:hypothetical protein HYH03_017968 [Edaphochlamys debaryana]|uniref:Uncharacterized protein n=1 Tax=Edaphochlamys debaryana TaxID=47281 RepID=A0A836BNE7_9CHLO|nr:hypothetical protein HYH03_017968 [Edaphochlamys debaryana]|eukprot:KAG2483176.1 hypothetical protein HYH03_017968 [Edaphochlamys debaryana]